MVDETRRTSGGGAVAEMQEFAGFSPPEQRYICRSIEVASGRRDALKRWARTIEEAASIRNQASAYRRLDALHALVPAEGPVEELIELGDAELGALIAVSAFDLGQGRIESFEVYRFLYERLLPRSLGPFLLSAFCGAAASPLPHPARRRDLLASISEEAATTEWWIGRSAVFVPQWVDEAEPLPTV